MCLIEPAIAKIQPHVVQFSPTVDKQALGQELPNHFAFPKPDTNTTSFQIRLSPGAGTLGRSTGKLRPTEMSQLPL